MKQKGRFFFLFWVYNSNLLIIFRLNMGQYSGNKCVIIEGDILMNVVICSC